MCCGQNRFALRNSQSLAAQQRVAQATLASSETGPANQAGFTQGSAQATTQPLAQGRSATVSEMRTAHTRDRQVSRVNIRYLGSSPIRVRGQGSGRYYEFSSARPLQDIDSRDAASILRTHFFRLA